MIEKVIDIAEKASAALIRIYKKPQTVDYKDDGSPLTKADMVSNQIIIDGLKSFCGYPIITEESYIDYETRKNWKYFWLVDPLDGTKDFMARNDQFTLNIALIEHCKPIMGVVCAPALHIIYHAVAGMGAYKNSNKIYNKSKRIKWFAADSVFHSTPEMKEFFERHGVEEVRKIGSALKICKLSEGEIDVYPRFNGTKEWDTAAAHIIANEAGCKLIDINTKKELTYNKKDMKNGYFIASRNDINLV